MTSAQTASAIQVYRVYIKAAPQAIWDAITRPEWTQRYGYGGLGEYDLRPGGAYRSHSTEEMKQQAAAAGYPIPDVGVDGEVIEVDPPRRLVLSWRMLFDPEIAAEGFTRLTYEIDEMQDGSSRVTLTHDLTGAPMLALTVAGGFEAEGAGGGWSWVLSDIKTLLETGASLRG
jgi:uncharacterized protein YndB with AHSA1/START domain